MERKITESKLQSGFKVFIFSALLSLLSACGNSSGGGGGGSSLDGSWGAIIVTISGSSMSISSPFGDIDGTISHEQGNIWSFVLSDGTEGGSIHDAARNHAFFLDEDFSVGVVQKSASGPASSYSGSDVDGSWSGEYAALDSNFLVVDAGTAGAMASSGGLTISGNSSFPDSFSGLVTIDSSIFGRWSGNIGSSASGSGGLTVFLSVDNNFTRSYACFGGSFPADCAFNMWVRQ